MARGVAASRRRRIFGAVAGMVLLLGGAEAQAAGAGTDDGALRERLDEMHSGVRAARHEFVLAQAGSRTLDRSPALARLEARISRLEEDLRTLTGQLEQATFNSRQLNQRLETALADVEARLDRLEGGDRTAYLPPSREGAGRTVTPPPPPAPPALPQAGALQERVPGAEVGQPAPPPPPGLVLPDGPPETQYAYAFGLLQKAQYDQAQAALTKFIETHPDVNLADNARYWLGETYYVKGDYRGAAESFLDAYESDKRGSKAPDALLKLGMSLARLEKPKEACTTLRELARAYPQAAPRIKSKADLEKRRLACN